MGLYVRRVNVYMVTLFTKVIKLTIVLMPPTGLRPGEHDARWAQTKCETPLMADKVPRVPTTEYSLRASRGATVYTALWSGE